MTLNTEEFIRRACEKHGDKYDYSKVVYVNSKQKVEIICNEHGSFFQTPCEHMKGKGCRNCGFILVANSNRSSKEDFIERAKSIHSNKYDYTNVVYVRAISKVEIYCNVHGLFFQTPSEHLSSKGCKKCGSIRSSNSQRKTLEQFIEQSNLVHSFLYDYSSVNYTNCKTNVEITCILHGSFWQRPSHHLNGVGCPKCLYKNETACREAIEKITGKLFPKIKPKFLEGLEYDMYNEDMKIAIEYDGEQHTKSIKNLEVKRNLNNYKKIIKKITKYQK